MRIHVLGANGPYPTQGGACSGYLAESDDFSTRIVLDMGAGTLSHLLSLCDLKDVSCVILSHLHYDHMSDLLPMRYALDFLNVPEMKVYLPGKPEKVRSLLDGRFMLYDIGDTTVGQAKIAFLPAVHPVEAYSVSIEMDGARLVYTGDTNVNPALGLFADGCDLLLADCGVDESVWTPKKPHMSPEKCARLACETGAKQLVLTHFDPAQDVEAALEAARAVYPRAEAAECGTLYYI